MCKHGVGCHFLLQRIFPTQGSNLGFPHCRQTLYRLSYQESPYKGLECKSRKSRNTWSNRQIWPWGTEWGRAKANRVLPREHTGHSKHPLPTKQEKTLGESDFDVDHLVMSMCRVFSCVIGRGCLLWPVCSLGKTLLVFALLHSIFQGWICLLLQVFLDFLLLHSTPL